ncbi:hypothetical protein [Elizabethkingia sp. M8]|uniref:hypothetical protein n=1 Tax=Elizabethkingia sp. M8 TaxID=2796140 RepID=UPI001903CDE1|nr:hypothetical protein [Elizabethkingia sp. M8]QQM25979.1 hypothetical protein JCR23_14050 [Elizabethkingia sp. M8]
MKTYISALLLAGATLTAVSCDRNNDTQIVNDQDTIALVTEAKVSFSKGNGYQVSVPFQKNIPTGDNVYVYRLEGVTNDGKDIWQPLPRTFYAYSSDGTVSKQIHYDFNFSVSGVTFFAGGTFNKDNPESYVAPYLQNQVFRAVIIPGNMSASAQASTKGNVGTSPVNYQDYNAVVKYYNIKESDVQVLK